MFFIHLYSLIYNKAYFPGKIGDLGNNMLKIDNEISVCVVSLQKMCCVYILYKNIFP